MISYKMMRNAIESIEKFHFLFTSVTAQRSSGGISSMYASLAKRVHNASSPQEISIIISEMKKKLRERIPDLKEFIPAFQEIFYTNNFSKQKNLVRYILMKEAQYYKLAFTCDYDDLTIEHIIPQKKIGSSYYDDKNIGSLGNLILVTKELNQKLGDKSSLQKLSVLRFEISSIPPDFRGKQNWTTSDIVSRINSLAKLAYEVIWKI